jgi:magnesium transporter
MTGMMDAFASIISNNVSFVVKFLTAITIVLTIPTIIASYYGMNVELPLQHSEHAFSILIALSVILAVISIVILWRKELF